MQASIDSAKQTSQKNRQIQKTKTGRSDEENQEINMTRIDTRACIKCAKARKHTYTEHMII